jgi:hypothetical protein
LLEASLGPRHRPGGCRGWLRPPGSNWLRPTAVVTLVAFRVIALQSSNS